MPQTTSISNIVTGKASIGPDKLQLLQSLTATCGPQGVCISCSSMSDGCSPGERGNPQRGPGKGGGERAAEWAMALAHKAGGLRCLRFHFPSEEHMAPSSPQAILASPI